MNDEELFELWKNFEDNIREQLFSQNFLFDESFEIQSIFCKLVKRLAHSGNHFHLLAFSLSTMLDEVKENMKITKRQFIVKDLKIERNFEMRKDIIDAFDYLFDEIEKQGWVMECFLNNPPPLLHLLSFKNHEKPNVFSKTIQYLEKLMKEKEEIEKGKKYCFGEEPEQKKRRIELNCKNFFSTFVENLFSNDEKLEWKSLNGLKFVFSSFCKNC